MYKYWGEINKHNSCIGDDSNNFIHHIPFAECFFMDRAQKKSIIFRKRKDSFEHFTWIIHTKRAFTVFSPEDRQLTSERAHSPTNPSLFEVGKDGRRREWFVWFIYRCLLWIKVIKSGCCTAVVTLWNSWQHSGGWTEAIWWLEECIHPTHTVPVSSLMALIQYTRIHI